MNRAYKYRIYPTEEQQTLINKTFGCCRFVWNNCVPVFMEDRDIWTLNNVYGVDVPEDYKERNYKSIKELRKEYEWMKEVSAEALGYKLQHFNEYKHQKFSRGKEVGLPKFKKKSSKQSYSLTNIRYELKDNKIRIEKIGWVEFVESRKIPENALMKSITISKNGAGHYYASILVECAIAALPKTNKSVGVDLGITDFAVTSDNIHISNPHYLSENQAKIARLQMWQAKKVFKSGRWYKLQRRISREHLKIANRRQNFLHNLSWQFARDYDVICMEDLNIKGMVKNHNLSKSISDVSWREFRRQIEYKSKWYGKEVRFVDTFFPSSKTCSCCGFVQEMPLNCRVFACPTCGSTMNRDHNAAVNILKHSTVRGGAQLTPSLAVTKGNEACRII